MFDSTDIDANIGDEVCDRNSNVRWRREQYSRGLLGKAEGLVESEYRQEWSALGGIGGIQENLNSRSGRRGTTGVQAGDFGRCISECKTRLADS